MDTETEVKYPIFVVFQAREVDHTTYEVFQTIEEGLKQFDIIDGNDLMFKWLMVQNERYGRCQLIKGKFPSEHANCFVKMKCTQEECMSFLCQGNHQCGIPC